MDDIRAKSAKVWYAIGVLILIFIIVWILSAIKNIVALLIVCTLISYVLRPLVDFLSNPISIRLGDSIRAGGLRLKIPFGGRTISTKKGLPRVAAISVTFIIVIGVTAMLITFIMPMISQEMKNFYAHRHSYKIGITSAYKGALDFVNNHIPSSIRPYINEASNNLNMESVLETARNAIASSMPAVKNFMSSISHLILVPFVTFYMLMDYEEYRQALLSLIPRRRKGEVVELLGEIDVMLKKYIKGQLLVCLIIGSSVTIAMLALDIPYALLIGAFAGAIDVIPYIGVIISLVPSVLLALMKSPLYAFLTLAVLYLIHWLEGHVIIPNIMGQSIKLPPLTVIISLIIGVEMMGIIGMFLAIPIAAVIRVVIDFYIRKRDEREALAEEREKNGGGPSKTESGDKSAAEGQAPAVENKGGAEDTEGRQHGEKAKDGGLAEDTSSPTAEAKKD